MKIALKSVFAAGMIVFSVTAFAQQYPVKPIRWIVAFAPGGPQDIRSRAIAIELANALKGNVIVENKAGAGGNIGMLEIAKAAPDGYTVGLGYVGTHSMNPHLLKASTFDPLKDHVFVAPITTYSSLLLVHPSIPVKTAGDLIAYAKANPGQVSFGTGGVGSTAHLAGEALRTIAGTPMLHVPFQGAAPVVTALMSGQITFTFNSMSTSFGPIKAGKLRALAITSPKRSSFAPDIPTMTESGVPGYTDLVSDQWTALFGPAALTKPIADRLRAGMSEAMRSTAVTERLRALAEDSWDMTPEKFPAFLQADIAKWGKIIKIAGVQPE